MDCEDEWQDRSMAVVHSFAIELKELHDSNPRPQLPVLPRALNHLMTELWDLGFNSPEISQAFNDALTDLPKYSAGER